LNKQPIVKAATVIVFILGVIWGCANNPKSEERTGAAFTASDSLNDTISIGQPEHPSKFSHSIHTGSFKLACKSCHRDSKLPASFEKSICGSCHSERFKEYTAGDFDSLARKLNTESLENE
jgi:hypothetical protein